MAELIVGMGELRELFLFDQTEILGEDLTIPFSAEDQARDLPARRRLEAIETGRIETNMWFKRKDGSRFFGNEVLTIGHWSRAPQLYAWAARRMGDCPLQRARRKSGAGPGSGQTNHGCETERKWIGG